MRRTAAVIIALALAGTGHADRGTRNAQITTAAQVAVSNNGNICIVGSGGAVQCIGSGQALGDSTTVARGTFAPAAIGSVTAIAGGDGQLGDGQCVNTPAQGAVQSGSITASDVGLAASATCAIQGGNVDCFGVDVGGAGGGCVTTPMFVGVSSVSHIVGGDSFFCTLDPQGTVACWGDSTARTASPAAARRRARRTSDRRDRRC